jgi:hypothetical protein
MKLQKQPIRILFRIALRHHAYCGDHNGQIAARYMQPSFREWFIQLIRQRLCSEHGTEQVTVNVSMAGLLTKRPYSNQLFVW